MASYAASATVFLLALCATAGPACAQRIPDEDPVVASAQLWDLDHDGTYTCDEWKQYATRLFNLADRNHDGYVDASEFKTIQKAMPMFNEATSPISMITTTAVLAETSSSKSRTRYLHDTTKTVIAG